MYHEINSKDNTLIKNVIRLIIDSSYRRKNNLAVISGRNLIIESLKHNLLQDILVSKSSLDKYADIITKIKASTKIHVLNEEVVKKINLVESGIDIIGVINIKTPIIDETIYNNDCIILENIADPGNLGTILRVAGAIGIKNMILSYNCVDVYSPKVLRSSAGIQFSLNVLANVEIKDFLSKYQGQVLATTPHTDSSIYKHNLTPITAWVFGNEGSGISPQLFEQIQIKVKIPMSGNAESLNVAMAATVCLFEMMRQRDGI